jgi:hypothetical protein
MIQKSIMALTALSAVLLLGGLSGCTQPQPQPTALKPWYPAVNENGDTLFRVFEGRIPCVDPARVGCEKIKVALAIYQHSPSKALTTYKLARVYVGTSSDGDRMVASGALTTTRGTKLHPEAVVYRLDGSVPKEFQSYWLIGDDILFLLDENLKPRVGTASWSYVLNRIR